MKFNRTNDSSNTRTTKKSGTPKLVNRRVTVRKSGIYPCIVSGVEAGTRPSQYHNGQSQPCLRWTFTPDGMADNETPILLVTGDTYGSPKSLCTQTVDAIVGRSLTDDEVSKLELTRLVGQRVGVELAEDVGDDDEPINRVEGLAREDSEPLDMSSILPKAPTKK